MQATKQMERFAEQVKSVLSGGSGRKRFVLFQTFVQFKQPVWDPYRILSGPGKVEFAVYPASLSMWKKVALDKADTI